MRANYIAITLQLATQSSPVYRLFVLYTHDVPLTQWG